MQQPVQRLTRIIQRGVIVFAALVVVGCSRYYRVTDPTTNRIYYTTDIDRAVEGAVDFRDSANGDRVTLQNSEVRRITKEEFEIGRVQREPASGK